MSLRGYVKRYCELRYWKKRRRQEGDLKHDHYRQFYTTTFGLTEEFYRGKRILDIGCGPRGSLEWAEGAAERVGLDPLAAEYLKLGAYRHKMTYAAASSDSIPYADGYFDVITSFNSLDHVDDLARTVQEITRVTKSGGTALLIVEINHPPTPTEPLTLTREILRGLFDSGFAIERQWYCAMAKGKHDVYGSVLENCRPKSEADRAIFCARLARR